MKIIEGWEMYSVLISENIEKNKSIKINLEKLIEEINNIIKNNKTNFDLKGHKVSTLDRNSFLHLEEYKKRLKVFKFCKKIILFMIIFIVLLIILINTYNKYIN